MILARAKTQFPVIFLVFEQIKSLEEWRSPQILLFTRRWALTLVARSPAVPGKFHDGKPTAQETWWELLSHDAEDCKVPKGRGKKKFKLSN